MNNLEFALEMKNKRLASGLSQGELASLTHVSRYSINRFENGKANASKETQNIILRCLNYYVCDKPFYLLVDYLSVRFPTTDALEVIRKVLGMKADYFIHYDYGYYGYKEHYAYGEIKVMASDDEHMGVFLELKGAGSRNMEYVLQAQNRDWYSFLNRCLDCGGVIRRFSFGVGSVGVNLQAYTYFVFPNASTYLYKYFPSVRWLSPVCRIRPLLSRLFSFMVSAPFLVGKSLDMTCVHHNTYKAHLH